VYCVWQVVKTQTIILNNPVHKTPVITVPRVQCSCVFKWKTKTALRMKSFFVFWCSTMDSA